MGAVTAEIHTLVGEHGRPGVVVKVFSLAGHIAQELTVLLLRTVMFSHRPPPYWDAWMLRP